MKSPQGREAKKPKKAKNKTKAPDVSRTTFQPTNAATDPNANKS
jgi:hypothetical protein